MTALTNTFTTATLVGNREDLSDVIANISPTQFPFSSAIGKRKATSYRVDWETDALAAPNLSNAQIEGDDISTFGAVTPTVKLSNYLQTMNKTIVVSSMADAINKAGRKSELAYQVTKKGKELRRDIESILLNNQASSNGSPRYLAGVESWIKTNTLKGTGAAADPTAADGTSTRTDGTAVALTEANFKTLISKCFISSGEVPDLVLATPRHKQAISTFTNGRTVFNKAESETLNTSFSVYSSDFGDLKITPMLFSRGVATSPTLLAINTDYWKMVNLRGVTIEDLAKTGDANKKYLVTDVSLEATNEGASGGMFDLI